MKKSVSIILSLVLTTSLMTGCGSANSTNDNSEEIAELKEQIEQLKEENEKLTKELDEAMKSVETATESASTEEQASKVDFVPELSGVCGADATWEYGNGVLYIHGSGEMADFSYSSWFEDGNIPWGEVLKDVIRVEIDDSITHIGSNAFNLQKAYPGDSALSIVKMPSGLKSIGDAAFLRCSQLEAIEIPDGVIRIGSEAFCYCDKLTTVVLPDGLESIWYDAFDDCKGLESIQWRGDSYSSFQELIEVLKNAGIEIEGEELRDTVAPDNVSG